MALFGKQRYITHGLILVSAVSLAGFVFVYSPDRLHTEFDDSYMYCRYASNFLSSHGFSWNSQEGPSHGATSPAYLVLITIVKNLFGAENSLLLSTASFSARAANSFSRRGAVISAFIVTPLFSWKLYCAFPGFSLTRIVALCFQKQLQL